MLSCFGGCFLALIVATQLLCLQAVIPYSRKSGTQRKSEQNYRDSSVEARLIRDLLSRYKSHGKFSRPLLRTAPDTASDGRNENKVVVKFGLRLMHVNLSEKEQVMRTSAWIRMQWYDEYLRWNKTEYSGISGVTLPYKLIWHPDIVLVNTAEANEQKRLPSVQVSSRGSVFWTPHAQFSSACLLDITNYPFDRHVCDMWFQSIANSRSRLALEPYHTAFHNTSFDLSTYFESYKSSQCWKIVDNMTDLFARPRDIGMLLVYSRRPALRFRLVLQRRSGFLAYFLIIPCTVVSFIIPVVFCLPPQRPDRLTTAMSLFASSLVLLLILVTEAPPSAASTPSLCVYYIYNLVTIMASIFCSVFVISVFSRSIHGTPIPIIVEKIFNKFLAPCLQVGRPVRYVVHAVPDKMETTIATRSAMCQQWQLLASVLDRIFFIIFISSGIVAFVVCIPKV